MDTPSWNTLGTCLWFDDQGEEAAAFYVSVFRGSRITRTTPYPVETPSDKTVGSVMTVDFELDGRPFTALNGGPQFTFTEAVSIVVNCASQEELLDGGEPGPCGWLKDRYGLSWQIVPTELIADPDPERAARATTAMLQMGKSDVAAVRAAADGSPLTAPTAARTPVSIPSPRMLLPW